MMHVLQIVVLGCIHGVSGAHDFLFKVRSPAEGTATAALLALAGVVVISAMLGSITGA